MIWIVGGTSETRELIERLEAGSYIVTVATYAGLEVLRGYDVVQKQMKREEMIGFIEKNKIDLVIDMTHPYAIEASENAKIACNEKGVGYIRYKRKHKQIDLASYFYDRQELNSYISKLRGTVFFTTGIKDIPRFEKLKKENRFIYRVLPTEFSIKACLENKLEMRDIVAMMGPFSRQLNVEIFKHFDADYVVMKDSGDPGGTKEKIGACLDLGIEPIVIGRSEEDGISDIDKILEMVQ